MPRGPSHMPAHVHTHAQRDPRLSIHTHTHPFTPSRTLTPHRPSSPGEPRGRDPPAGMDTLDGVRPWLSQGLGPGSPWRSAAGDSAAPPSPGRSAEPPPGCATLAPALCYANSPSQLVPAACTMSAGSPRQPGSGGGVGGVGAPRPAPGILAWPSLVRW